MNCDPLKSLGTLQCFAWDIVRSADNFRPQIVQTKSGFSSSSSSFPNFVKLLKLFVAFLTNELKANLGFINPFFISLGLSSESDSDFTSLGVFTCSLGGFDVPKGFLDSSSDSEGLLIELDGSGAGSFETSDD